MLFKCGEYPQRRQHEEVCSIGIGGSGSGDVRHAGSGGRGGCKAVRTVREAVREAVPDVRAAVQYHPVDGERDRQDRGTVSTMPEAVREVR